MKIQSSFLTLGVENPAVLPSDNASVTTENTNQATTDAAADTTTTTPATDATTSAPADTTTDANGNINLEGFTEITTDENGNAVLVNPETGETKNPADLGIDLSSAVAGTEAPAVEHKEMTGLIGGLYVVYAIFCVGLIVLVLSQKKRSAAFGNGMGSSAQTYWDKNKGRSMEGKLDLYTKIGIAIFIIFTFVITLI